MGGIDPRADEAVADVVACPEGGFYVGAVVGVHIHRVVRAGPSGGIDQLGDHLIAVRAAGILGADGDLPLGAVQPFAHAAHIHGNGLGDASGDAGAAAMAHFLIDRDVGVELPLRLNVVILQVFGKAQQDAHRQLVIQEPALEIAGGGAAGAGIEADDITDGNAQCLGFLGGGHALIQNDLNGIIGPLGIRVIAIDVDGGVCQLTGALVDLATAGIDPDILRFGVVGAHAAQRGQLQAAVAFDLADHGTQGVGVGLQKQGVPGIFAAQLHKNTALGGDARGAAQTFKGVFYPPGRVCGKAGRRVDPQKGGGLFPGKISIAAVNHDSFLLIKCSARHRRPPA